MDIVELTAESGLHFKGRQNWDKERGRGGGGGWITGEARAAAVQAGEEVEGAAVEVRDLRWSYTLAKMSLPPTTNCQGLRGLQWMLFSCSLSACIIKNTFLPALLPIEMQSRRSNISSLSATFREPVWSDAQALSILFVQSLKLVQS